MPQFQPRHPRKPESEIGSLDMLPNRGTELGSAVTLSRWSGSGARHLTLLGGSDCSTSSVIQGRCPWWKVIPSGSP